MTIQEQVEILRQGTEIWNQWRKENPDEIIDLSGADLSRASLPDVNLSGAALGTVNFEGANLRGANLTLVRAGALVLGVSLIGSSYLGAINFNGADLSEANLNGSNFIGGTFVKANMTGCSLIHTNLLSANLSKANLAHSVLRFTGLTGAKLCDATLNGAEIYGIAAWDADLTNASQSNLIIKPKSGPEITVDDLHLAHAINMLLDNDSMHNLLSSVGKKMVLILGSFSTSNMEILRFIAEEVRNFNLLPIIFTFGQPDNLDLLDTVTTLAGLANFVIADLTDQASVPAEIASYHKQYDVPTAIILRQGSNEPFSVSRAIRNRIGPITYESKENLRAKLQPDVFNPAISKRMEINGNKQSTLDNGLK
jgi:uncharacterized protein YjbI with pentapeptide repeats